MIPGDNKYIFGGLVISKFQLMNSNFGENNLKFPNHTHSDLFCILANLRICKPHKNDELVTSQTLMLPLIKTFFFLYDRLNNIKFAAREKPPSWKKMEDFGLSCSCPRAFSLVSFRQRNDSVGSAWWEPHSRCSCDGSCDQSNHCSHRYSDSSE